VRKALRRAALFSLWLAAAPAAAADASAYLFTRPLDVPAAGPVAAPLDVAALRHLGAGSPAVFAPDGSEVPSRLEHDADCCRVQADLVEARQEGESWRLVLDLGPTPPLHEQLHFRLRRTDAAAEVRLEGSDDRETWRPLAAGSLFRLGSRDELERTALVYPPNRHRWLRLTWPAAAGKPELRGIEVVGGRTLAVGAERPACRREGAADVCRLPLPAPHPIGLRFRLRFAADGYNGPGSRVGYRLSRPFDARWETLSEGTAPLADGRLVLPLPSEPLAGEPLRLELYGDPAPPRLAAWTLELAQPVVVFAAPRAGRYTLAYGGGPAPAEGREAASSEGAVRVAPGLERRQSLPPLPAAAVAPGAPLDAKAFAASWPVRAPRAQAGEVVRLELPPAVLAAADFDLSDIRLAVGERQLPFLRLDPDTPVLAVARRGLRPAPERRGRTSRVAVAVDRERRLSALSLTAAPPFRRGVAVWEDYALPPLRNIKMDKRGVWDCAAQPPLLCRWEAGSLGGLSTNRVIVRFEDGDNPPLPSVDVALWRRRHLLVFVWPAAGEVRLLAGARGDPAPAAPRYDLELLAPQLAVRPWRAAAVDVGGGTRMEERGPAWLPLMIPAVLALAAVVLLVVLARVIGRRP
jgi:Protein of unknown function (DUF3999)